MPDQEQQQPDGSDFVVNGELENGVSHGEQDVAPVERSSETQPDQHLEDEGRYDEQKAANIGAAVLERDRLNALEPDEGPSTDRYKRELADIDEDIQRVKDGALSNKLTPQTQISVPADAEETRRLNYMRGTDTSKRLGDLHDKDREQQQDIQGAERRLKIMQTERADELERARREYDKFVVELEKKKQAAIESGEYDDEWAQDFEAEKITFPEYLQKRFFDFRDRAVQESYPNLRSDSYDLIAQIEKAKDRNAKYRSELSSLELPEVDKVRERKRGQMQGYLNKWTDYYAELYELNPEMFAAMPTKEFMEHKAEFTGLEQARVAQERYEQGCASVADTLRRVLVEADDVENNPRPKDNREGVEDPYHIWFDHQFLRNDYRVTTMLKTFHGYDYDLSDAFAKNRNGYDSLMLDYVDTITSGKTEFYTREGYKKISPEERALWEETEAYFNDYAKKRLDVTPRQLIEGYTTIVEKSKDEIQARLDETNAKIAEFKQRFARQQEGQTGEVFENN